MKGRAARLVRVNGTDFINEPARANAWGKADLLRSSARVMSVLRDLEVERKIPADGRGFPVLDEGLKFQFLAAFAAALARMESPRMSSHTIYDLPRPSSRPLT